MAGGQFIWNVMRCQKVDVCAEQKVQTTLHGSHYPDVEKLNVSETSWLAPSPKKTWS